MFCVPFGIERRSAEVMSSSFYFSYSHDRRLCPTFNLLVPLALLMNVVFPEPVSPSTPILICSGMMS
jgi:hypothetical protein